MTGETEQKTNITCKYVDDFDTFINAIDGDFDSEDVIFSGWLYKLNTAEFNKAIRSQYGKTTRFKQEIVVYTGNNCYIPTSGNWFMEKFSYLTGEDYREIFFNFYSN